MRSAASLSPPKASSGCSSAASRNARAACGSPMPRRTSTWASTPETRSCADRRSAAAHSYGSRVRRASLWVTGECMDCGADGTVAAQQISRVWDEGSPGIRWASDGYGSGRCMKALGVVLVSAAVLVGCGGGGSDGPTAREKRAALDNWTQTADAACEKANKSIAKRGWPVNLVDLDRLTVRAVTDVQAASKTIRAQKAPAGSEDKVKPFVQSLEDLDGTMKQLSDATEDFKIKRLDRFLPKLGGSLQKVETESKELGLRKCAAHDEHVFIPDAVRAPVFAQQLADLDRKLVKRTKRLNASSAPTRSRRRRISGRSATSRTPTRAGWTTSGRPTGRAGSPTTTSWRCARSGACSTRARSPSRRPRSPRPRGTPSKRSSRAP